VDSIVRLSGLDNAKSSPGEVLPRKWTRFRVNR